MTVRMYSSMDAGVPTLPNLSSQRLIDNLRIILRACLVDGYAGKPGAGWTVTHDVADGFSLSNGEGVVNFVNVSASVISIYLMEAVTDGSTALAGGVNRRSGAWFDGEATTARHLIYSAMYGTQALKEWSLVADGATVTMLLQQGITTVDNTGAPSSCVLHFGRYYPVLGGAGFTALGGSPSQFSGAVLTRGATGTVLRNPFTGLIGQGVAPGYHVAGRSALTEAVTPYQHQVFQPRSFQLFRAGVAAVGVGLSGSGSLSSPVFCGVLRGVLIDPVAGVAMLSQVLPAIGVATPVPADRLRSFMVSTKPIWPVFQRTDDLGVFVSLDENDWAPLWT